MNYIYWIIIGVVVACFIVYCLVPNKREYVCPNCQNKFIPKKLQLAFTAHSGSKKLLSCPNCGKRSLMKPYSKE